MSRRGLLLTAASAVIVDRPLSATAAPQQVSQAAALYQDHPKNGLSCAACALFRPPAACVVVVGRINANGWCRFFDLPD
ncbi:MAG TPA: hypothetical protein VL985_07600 [Stellaceae bacterium]|nr:hypothetical protein [Stellaceae bacterium]